MNPKITSEDIITAAFNIVRQDGWEKFSAREIAKALNMSTMPIYSNFRSLALLEEAVVRKAMELLREYQSKRYVGDPTIDRGIGYFMFAREETHLFQTINDEKGSLWQAKYGDPTFDQHVKELSKDKRLKGLSSKQLRQLNTFLWIFIHGMASLKNWMNIQQISEKRTIDLLQEGGGNIIKGFLSDLTETKERK